MARVPRGRGDAPPARGKRGGGANSGPPFGPVLGPVFKHPLQEQIREIRKLSLPARTRRRVARAGPGVRSGRPPARSSETEPRRTIPTQKRFHYSNASKADAEFRLGIETSRKADAEPTRRGQKCRRGRRGIADAVSGADAGRRDAAQMPTRGRRDAAQMPTRADAELPTRFRVPTRASIQSGYQLLEYPKGWGGRCWWGDLRNPQGWGDTINDRPSITGISKGLVGGRRQSSGLGGHN